MDGFQEKLNSVANFLEEMNSVVSLVKKQRINDPSMMNWSLQLKDAIDEVEFTRTARTTRIVKESPCALLRLFFSEGATAVAPWARAMGGGGRVDAPTLCCDQERCSTGWRRRQEREKRRKP
uniref:Rx N-terminal domain-containing protein n=1 Tax=Oryza barthii TaxID=65489 RepID=A0A0D3GCK1_9ORYZ